MKIDKVRLGRRFDGRYKLSDEVREEIARLQGVATQTEVAEKYGISRKLVYYIWHPDKYQEHLAKRREAKVWKKNYSKHKHREYIRRNRNKKRELLDKGLLKLEEEDNES